MIHSSEIVVAASKNISPLPMDISPTLYVLDDDAQYAQLLAEISADNGWNAFSEQSPVNFLTYDLVDNGLLILDLDMPEMDGIEVIRELAKQGSNLLLILISGFDAGVLHSAQQLAEAHNIRVFTSLPKPVNITEFIEILNFIKTSHNEEDVTEINLPEITGKELEKAIKLHQLVLHYQPQLDIKTGHLTGVEALVRWQHPVQGLIFPDKFISLSEKEGLIGALTDEIIAIAAEQIMIWESQGLDLVTSINVSADNIISLSLPEQLIKVTEKYRISPKKITLELTESAVMGELTSSLDVLNRLRMKGFSLSIDDFGTGYSSLVQLYQAPFTEIKIDRRFVSLMLEDKAAMAIVEICIMLGHKLGVKLVAEGIESRQVWDKLNELGCDIAQGYYISKPIPASDMSNWIRNLESNPFI